MIRRILPFILALLIASLALSPVLAVAYNTGGADTYVVVDTIRPGGTCASPNEDNSAYNLHTWKLPAGGLTYKIATKSIPSGVIVASFISAINAAAAAWDGATEATLLNYGGTVNDDKEGTFNGVSTVKYGGQVPMGAIAVAWVRVVDGVVAEADIRLAKGFKWSANGGATDDCGGGSGMMDLGNIMTHEWGHAVGVAHTSADSANNAQTMYPYASYQELYKRSLADGDLSGLSLKYGE